MKYKHYNPFDYVDAVYNQETAIKSVQDMVIQLDNVSEIHDYMSVIEMIQAQVNLFVNVNKAQFPDYGSVQDYRNEYFTQMGGQEAVEARYRGGALDPDREEYYDNIRRELNQVQN